jgi:RNA recognition motif-containing protein
VQVFADGVGSVTFDSPNDARTAVNGMNGFVLEGLQLRVRQE